MSESNAFCPVPTVYTLDPETGMVRNTRTGFTSPLKDFASILPVVVIDAGHGVSAPGYAAFGTQRGAVSEPVLARQMAMATAAELTPLGYNVIVTRERDTVYRLNDAFAFRHETARVATAAYLSMHVNGSTVASMNGAELFSDSRLPDNHPSHRLRQELASQLSGRVSQSRGDWRMINPQFIGDIPAVLVEAGYLTHDGDYANLTSPAWRQSFARKLAHGVDDFHRSRHGARNVEAECTAGLQSVIGSTLGLPHATQTDDQDFSSGLQLFQPPSRRPEKTPVPQP